MLKANTDIDNDGGDTRDVDEQEEETFLYANRIQNNIHPTATTTSNVRIATTTKATSRDIGRDDRYNTRGDTMIRYDTIRYETITPMATAILVPIRPYDTNQKSVCTVRIGSGRIGTTTEHEQI